MRFTHHATERMKQMRVGAEEVRAVFRAPSALDYPSPPTYPEGRRVRVSGDLAVVYDPDAMRIITVLWNGKEGREEEAG